MKHFLVLHLLDNLPLPLRRDCAKLKLLEPPASLVVFVLQKGRETLERVSLVLFRSCDQMTSNSTVAETMNFFTESTIFSHCGLLS